MGNYNYEEPEENTQYPTGNEIVDNPILEIYRIFNILFSFQNRKKEGKEKEEKSKERIECIIPEKEFKVFLNCMKDYKNQLYFLNKITKARAASKEIPEDVFKYLEQIFFYFGFI